MFNHLQNVELSKTGFAHLGEDARERALANRQFEQAIATGRAKQMRARMLMRSRSLKSLKEAQENASVSGQHYAGVQVVPLEAIRGSENRTKAFDIDFYPMEEHLEQRWIRVATAYLRDINLPPVELIQVGDVYYVRDGHHRISVARAYGHKSIEAVVIRYENGPLAA